MASVLLPVVFSALMFVVHSEILKIKTRSGVSIPFSTFQHYTNFLNADEITDRIFELRNLVLTTSTALLDLEEHTSEPELISSRKATIVVDGKIVPHTSKYDTYLRRGSNYNVAISGVGQVVGIWGPEMVLKPIHPKKFPNVFINVYRLKTDMRLEERLYFGNDTKTISKGANEKRIFSVGITTSEEGISGTAFSSSTKQTSCSTSGSCRKVRVAAVGDSYLCTQYGGVTGAISRLTARIYIASVPYESQTCLKIVPVYFEFSCTSSSDPYRDYTSNPDTILDKFTLYWKTYRSSVVRDLAHFFPGPYVNDGLSGNSWIGTACSKSAGYAWSEDQEPAVIAHGVGHNLNCDHTSTGIMKPSWSRGDPLHFSTSSVNTITSYVDSIGSSTCVPICETSTPTPTSSPTPSTSTIVCTDGFSRLNVFSCGKVSYGSVYAPGYENILNLNVYRKQLRNFNVFYLKTTNKHTKISEFISKVTMSASTPSEIASRVVYAKPKRKVVVKMSNFNLETSDGQSTCCGNQVYLHINVEFCHYKTPELCAAGIVYLNKVMQCETCDKAVFSSQTPWQRCPICKD